MSSHQCPNPSRRMRPRISRSSSQASEQSSTGFASRSARLIASRITPLTRTAAAWTAKIVLAARRAPGDLMPSGGVRSSATGCGVQSSSSLSCPFVGISHRFGSVRGFGRVGLRVRRYASSCFGVHASLGKSTDSAVAPAATAASRAENSPPPANGTHTPVIAPTTRRLRRMRSHLRISLHEGAAEVIQAPGLASGRAPASSSSGAESRSAAAWPCRRAFRPRAPAPRPSLAPARRPPRRRPRGSRSRG